VDDVLINSIRDSLINCADWTVLKRDREWRWNATKETRSEEKRIEVKREDRPGIDPRTAQRSAAVLLIN
jgi:hypothetical protein